jgi:hypothetical protein
MPPVNLRLEMALPGLSVRWTAGSVNLRDIHNPD